MKTAIIVVTYNCPKLLPIQIELVNRFCTDKFDFIVIDNSNDDLAINRIKHFAQINGCKYIKTNATSSNGSDSHAFAANLSYTMFGESYDYFFYIDHDCFPVKPFSVFDTLKEKDFAGIGQTKPKATYLWQGCLMFKRVKDIDFSPNHELGLDTGGNIYKLLTEGNTLYFNETYEQNPQFTKPPYNFYSMINNGTFMHFVNGSNWNKSENNEERVNSLINVLHDKTGGNILS